MTPAERMKRAHDATAAMEVVAPIIEALRSEYMAAQMKAAINEPHKPDKIIKLSVAQRVINTVESHLRAAIADGGIAAQEKNRADEIANMPEAKRRWL